nr:ATP-binding protein [Ectobacillus ponti]
MEHYGLNELNFEAVKLYRQLFAARKLDHPWNGLETKDFLYKIGAWGKLRNGSKEGLTLAGLLMFSEERMITEVLPHYFLEYREYEADGEVWSKRFTSQDGTWSGNMFDFYFKVIKSLSQEKAEIEAALQEGLMNALVHADYENGGGILVEGGPGYVRISNPGLLLAPVKAGTTVSILRNPNIVKILVLAGLCQRAGSGLKQIRAIWEKQGWPQPELLQDGERERTVLFLQMETVLVEVQEEIDTDVPAIAEEWEPEEESSYNNADSLNKEFANIGAESNSYISEINSSNNVHNSYNKEENSLNNELNSVNKENDSYNKEELWQSGHEAAAAVAGHTDQLLWDVGELARRKRRLSPHQMEEVILRLVAIRPLRLKELAELLGRTPDGLRNNYLSKLTDEGKLRLKYPDQVNHPKQAYLLGK